MTTFTLRVDVTSWIRLPLTGVEVPTSIPLLGYKGVLRTNPLLGSLMLSISRQNNSQKRQGLDPGYCVSVHPPETP